MIKTGDDSQTTIHCDVDGCRVWSGPSENNYYEIKLGSWFRVTHAGRTLDICGPECLADYANGTRPKWQTSVSSRSAPQGWALSAVRNGRTTAVRYFDTQAERDRAHQQWISELTGKRDADLDAWFRAHAYAAEP